MTGGRDGSEGIRERRLADALRANLQRRKRQQRERSAAGGMGFASASGGREDDAIPADRSVAGNPDCEESS